MKSKTTKERLNRLITEDREEINDGTRAAALLDFTRVAREYFDTENVEMNIKRAKGGTDVSVSFRASRVKNFTTLK